MGGPYVKEHKERAMFWHSIRKENGSPRGGIVADIRRRTRAKYHYATRYIKKNNESIKYEKMASAMSNDSGRDLRAEVPKIKGKAKVQTGLVDGVSTKAGIGELFARKFESLYNSVSYEKEQMDELHSGVSNVCMKGLC